MHENATRPAGSRSLVEITRRALDRMLYNARLGAWIRPIFPFAATDRGSADWAPESRRNQASMEPRAVESDCLPYARIAGSSGAALLAQHEGLHDAQTPGLFQVRCLAEQDVSVGERRAQLRGPVHDLCDERR